MKNRELMTRNMLLFTLGQGISKLGSSLTYYALSLYILDITKNGSLFAFILSIKFLPQILLYPIAGAIVDSVNKKMMLITLDLLRGVVLIGAIALTFNNTIEINHIIILIIILSLAEVLYNPTTSAIIPFIFREDEYLKVNSSLSWISSASILVAPMLGSYLFKILDIKWIMLIDGISYFVVVILALWLRITSYKKKSSHNSSFLKDIRVGFNVLMTNRDIGIMTMAISISRFFVNPLYSIGLPLIILNKLSADEVVLGSVQSMLMLGALVSPVIVMILNRYNNDLKSLMICRGGKTIPFALFMILGIRSVENTLNGSNILIILSLGSICFMASMFNSSGFVFLNTYFQKRVSKDHLGRFSSIRYMIYSITEPLGMNIFGLLYSQYSLSLSLIAVFLGVIIEVALITYVYIMYNWNKENSIIV